MHHHIETVSQPTRLCPADIRKLKDITIVVSEQVLSFTLEIADRFFVIDKGRFIHEETRDPVDAAKIARYLAV